MKIAVLQMTSVLDCRVNMEKIATATREIKNQGIEYLFLPECFYSMTDGTRASPHLLEAGNEHHNAIGKLAADNGVYLIGGSAATKEDGRVFNRALNFSPKGEDLGHYDKMHLFSCDLPKADRIEEADIYTPGKERKIIQAGPFNVGLGICFDLRYPEMSRDYVLEGANLLTFASAFTVVTGQAHWHTLVRARAIENQCFVVASAQYGRHNERIRTFGHSLIVDPWGKVLADAKEGEKWMAAEVDLGKVSLVRKKVRVF